MALDKSGVKKLKDKIYKAKWKSLKARGINPPSTPEEAKQRLKEAHGY